MPCFIKNIRRLGIPMPDRVSLFTDAETIEEELKKLLGLESHRGLHVWFAVTDQQTIESTLNKVLETVSRMKVKNELPDRMTEARDQYKKLVKAT